jgi:FkbM family methyltransferase
MKGFWDCHDILAALLPHSTQRQNCTVVDVGANIGTCSLFAYNLGYSIVAVEPNPDNFALLNSSFSISQRAWRHSREGPRPIVKLFNNAASPLADLPVAVSDTPDRDPSQRKWSAYRASEFNDDESGAYAHEQSENHEMIRTIRLDDTLTSRGLPPVCLLKIDTEGYEMPVLQGAMRMLQTPGLALVIEFGEVNGLELLHFLHDRGFRIFVIREPVKVSNMVEPTSLGDVLGPEVRSSSFEYFAQNIDTDFTGCYQRSLGNDPKIPCPVDLLAVKLDGSPRAVQWGLPLET